MSKTVVARHKVGDIDVWLKGHQDRVSLFALAVSSFKTFQDTDDPKSIMIVFEVNDLGKLESIIKDPKNQAIKKKHTVLEPIKLSMPVDL